MLARRRKRPASAGGDPSAAVLGPDGLPIIRQRRPQRPKQQRPKTAFFDKTDVFYILMIFIAPITAFIVCRSIAESSAIKPVLTPVVNGAVVGLGHSDWSVISTKTSTSYLPKYG